MLTYIAAPLRVAQTMNCMTDTATDALHVLTDLQDSFTQKKVNAEQNQSDQKWIG